MPEYVTEAEFREFRDCIDELVNGTLALRAALVQLMEEVRPTIGAAAYDRVVQVHKRALAAARMEDI